MPEIHVENPVTGERVGQVQVTGAEAIETLARAAREAQPAWQGRGWSKRRDLLLRFHDRLFERETEILDCIQAETGKSRRDAFTEILSVAGTARYYAFRGRHHVRDRRHRGAIPFLTWGQTRWVPHALVGFVTPWNYPFLLAIADTLPALAGGSAVLVKPSERAPLSAVLGRQLLVDSGLDPRLFGIVHGGAPQAIDLIGHLDYLAFTGGRAAGRAVASAAGERLIDCSLELGGKNPMIVGEGARIADAVESLAASAFVNSGQACISIERVYVVDSLYDAFLEAAEARISRMRLGWSKAWDIDMGSLIGSNHAHRVAGHISEAVALGARIVAGGRLRPDLGPAFLEPTLLTDVDSASKLAMEETFGPVVSIYRVSNTAEAVQRANDSPYGLHASVWGSAARDIARQVQAGSVGVRSTLQIYGSFDVPMGGIAGSGFGRRHGAEGIRRFGTTRSLVGGPKAGGGYDTLWSRLRSPKDISTMKRVYSLWRRVPGIR